MPLYLRLLHDALATEFQAILPIVMILLASGLATGILQAAFQIEDGAFSLLPRLIIMIAIAMLGGFGLFGTFKALAVLWLGHAALLVHQSWS
jgi:flagellar biosynthesis protein FliQ